MITVSWLHTAQSINTTMAALIHLILAASSVQLVTMPLNTSCSKLLEESTLMVTDVSTMLSFPTSSDQAIQFHHPPLLLSQQEQAARSNRAKVFAAHLPQDQAR
jgi:hypothetical protein